MKKNIVLTLRVTPERAKTIINRLYGTGDIDSIHYKRQMERIDSAVLVLENARNKRLQKLFENGGTFYKKNLAHAEKHKGVARTG